MPEGYRHGMDRVTRWEAKVRQDPSHSHWFVERFRTMAAEGKDLDGEARLIDAMVARNARVLDAGCGSGRIGSGLLKRGHTVVGVDVDPVLIDAARTDHPGGQWIVGDLADLDLAGLDPTTSDLSGVDLARLGEPFDAVVCGGNVMPFLAPGSAVRVLGAMARHTTPSGRVVVGFGAGRGYPFQDYLADVERAGLRVDLTLSSWDLRPYTPDAEFLVTILSHGAGGAGESSWTPRGSRRP